MDMLVLDLKPAEYRAAFSWHVSETLHTLVAVRSEIMCLAVLACRAYKFRVKVFCPWTNQIEVVEVTDPYSRCTTGQ